MFEATCEAVSAPDEVGSPGGADSPRTEDARARCLIQRFDAALGSPSANAMAGLRTATMAFAAALRAIDVSPERALIELKELLSGHGDAGWSPSLVEQGDTSPKRTVEYVYSQLFAWWLEAYYGDEDR